MNEEEVIQALQVVRGGTGHFSDELITKCSEDLCHFQDSEDGINWAVKILESPLDEIRLNFSLNTLQTWISARWAEITMPAREVIHSILFESLPNFSKTQDNFDYHKLSKVQLTLLLQLDYQLWTQSISIAISHLPDLASLNFLNALTEELYENPDKHFEFIKKLQENGVLFQILTKSISYLSPALPPTFSTLFFSIVINVTFPSELFSQTTFSTLIAGLSQAQTAEPSLRILGSYVSSDSPKPDLSSFPDILHSVITNYDDPQILTAASSLIGALGAVDLENSGSEFFTLALQMMKHANDMVSINVLQYIQSFLEINAERIPEVFSELFARLAMCFNEEYTESLYEASLVKVIASTIRISKEFFSSFISTIPSHDQDEAALFCILNRLHEEFISVDGTEKILGDFSFILEMEPPLDTRQANAFIMYSAYFVRRSQIDGLVTQEFFNNLLNHAVSSQNPDFFRKSLMKSIEELCLNPRAQQFSVDSSMIAGFITIGTADSISIASILMRMAGDGDDIYDRAIDFFLTTLRGSDDPKYFLPIALKFINGQKYQASRICANNRFFSASLELASRDDVIFSVFLDSMHSALEGQCYEIFSASWIRISGIETTTKACQIASLLWKQITDHGWINVFLDRIIQLIPAFIQQVSNWFDISQEANEGRQLLAQFYNFCTMTSSSISEERISQILEISEALRLVVVGLPEVLYCVVRFFSSLPSSFSPELLATFPISPITIVNEKEFIPYAGNWKRAMKEVSKYHNRLNLDCQPQFDEDIRKMFAGIQGGSDLASEYLSIISNEQGSEKLVGEFYGYLCELRRSGA